MTVVTSIKTPEPGQEVSINNAHLVTYSGVRWMGESLLTCTFFIIATCYILLLHYSVVWG